MKFKDSWECKERANWALTTLVSRTIQHAAHQLKHTYCTQKKTYSEQIPTQSHTTPPPQEGDLASPFLNQVAGNGW